MTIGNKIINERKNKGWTQEELANKLNVSAQTVSNWERSDSIPDLQSVVILSDLFGVSTDYLLREDSPSEKTAEYPDESIEEDEPVRRVSLEEANDFLDMKRKGSSIVSTGVAMCITSPVLLIVLDTLVEGGMLNITENLAGGMGAVFLFLMVASAVFMFITHGLRGGRMEHIENENFVTEYGVAGMAKERRDSYAPVFTRGIAVGVVLCILSVVPIIIAGAVELPEHIIPLFVAPLLLMIAVGVSMIIRVSIVMDSYKALLQEGEFSKSEKRSKGKLSLLSGVYWSLTAAIYLGWSFWTMRWDVSWIIWPVAGVLFVAVSRISKIIIERRR
ncbi:MAG: helix-turn-helix transcriptional regulator [Ruminococcaceae bacterium]|mgnify:CR=1 FL=1|nr:helix-turn-helix transcriptional regulator [Oscillospiraceae bacterium]